MFKNVSFITTLLIASSMYADVHVVARLEFTSNNETKTVHYDKLLKDNGTETYTSDDGISITGSIDNIDDRGVGISFDIKDADGKVISHPSMHIESGRTATVKLANKRNDQLMEQVVLYATVSRS